MRAVLHGCLGAALSLLFLAGAAEGQATPTVHIEIEVRAPVDDNGRLMPEVEKAEFPIIVRLKFPPLPGVCTSEYEVVLDVVGQLGYQSVTLNPSRFRGTGSMGVLHTPGTVEHRAILSVAVGREAPAFKDEEYQVKGQVLFPATFNGCTYSGGPSVTARAVMKNDYVPGITVAPYTTTMTGPSGSFLIRVANIGNGPTRVRTDVIAEDDAAFAALRGPADLRLESRASKGSAAFWTGDFAIDYAVAKPGTHTFTAVFLATYDGAGSDTGTAEQRVTFSVTSDVVSDEASRTTGGAKGDEGDPVPELPGLAPLAALGTLTAAALWRRRQDA